MNGGAAGAPPLALAGACDCHIHINDPRYAYVAGADLRPPLASIADYRVLQARLGTSRVVVVHPSSYGADNACTLNALAEMAAQGMQARGIAVVDAACTEADIARMHAQGMRGVRFNLLRPSPVGAEALARTAALIAPFGWHLQLHASADALVAMEDAIARLPLPVVFDHMGRIPPAQVDTHAAFGVIARRLEAGRAWVKLSGAELDGAADAPRYAPAMRLARRFLGVAAGRMLWGSNWPHPATSKHNDPWPDDVGLLRCLLEVLPDAAGRQAVLVDNPARLYGFAETPALLAPRLR